MVTGWDEAVDPPTHTNHRSLLMRLITPKRLKDNEEAMWVLADRALDTFLAKATSGCLAFPPPSAELTFSRAPQ
jgi:cytochrome P450